MKPIKIGQIGVGHEHASGKMDALRRLTDFFEVVGVAGQDAPDRLASPTYQGIPHLTEDELLRTPGLEAVAVEPTNKDLVATAMRCLERGLPMHMDKPGGETMEPFRALVEGCRNRGLAFQMGYMYRTNPAVLFCFRALREGWLGDVFEVHAVMSRYDEDPYRQYLSQFPGGAMYNFGCHLVDLVVAMLGRPDNVVAFQKSTRGDGLMDNGLAVLEYPRATATIRTSVAEVDGMNHRRLVVCGTRGTVEICPLEHPWNRQTLDPLHVRLTLLQDNADYAAGTHRVNVGVMNYRYDDQLIEFARVIRGEVVSPFTYEHDLTVQETLLAAAGYTKWDSGCTR